MTQDIGLFDGDVGRDVVLLASLEDLCNVEHLNKLSDHYTALTPSSPLIGVTAQAVGCHAGEEVMHARRQSAQPSYDQDYPGPP